MAVYGFWAIDDNYLIQHSLQLTQYEKIAQDPLYLGHSPHSAGMALMTTFCAWRWRCRLAWFIVALRPAALAGAADRRTDPAGLGQRADPHLFDESGARRIRPAQLALLRAGPDRRSPLEILFTKTAVVIGLVYIYLPYTMVPIYAADRAARQARPGSGRESGRRPGRALPARSILPLIMPGIVAGCIITFIPALGEYLVPNLLGGLQGMMYGNLIATAFQSFNWPLGSALSVVLLASILACLLFVAVAVRRRQPRPAGRGVSGPMLPRWLLGRLRARGLCRSSICRSRWWCSPASTRRRSPRCRSRATASNGIEALFRTRERSTRSGRA